MGIIIPHYVNWKRGSWWNQLPIRKESHLSTRNPTRSKLPVQACRTAHMLVVRARLVDSWWLASSAHPLKKPRRVQWPTDACVITSLILFHDLIYILSSLQSIVQYLRPIFLPFFCLDQFPCNVKSFSLYVIREFWISLILIHGFIFEVDILTVFYILFVII